MKKKILIVALLLSGFAIENTTAQLRVGLNINIGSQPVWGPVGYDHVEYYYMPDIDAYYNVSSRQYIYMERGRWRFAYALPASYHYDLYSGYKVVINEYQPYRNAEVYRTKYGSYKGNRSQEIIRNSNDNRYFENKNHPRHGQWKNDNNRNYNNGNNNNRRYDKKSKNRRD